MSKLVEELKKDHALIAEALNEVKKLGASSAEGQTILIAARSGLLVHLKKEDEQLYPVLNKAAESDSNLKKNLDIFARDMDEITKAAWEFFDKYSTGGSGIEFAKDFGRLYSVLSQRISKEERIIYEKYDELTNQEDKEEKGTDVQFFN